MIVHDCTVLCMLLHSTCTCVEMIVHYAHAQTISKWCGTVTLGHVYCIGSHMAAPSVSEVDICNFAFEGRLELVRASLDKIPELVNKTDSSKRSALHWACSAGRDDVVRFLLSKGAQV